MGDLEFCSDFSFSLLTSTTSSFSNFSSLFSSSDFESSDPDSVSELSSSVSVLVCSPVIYQKSKYSKWHPYFKNIKAYHNETIYLLFFIDSSII